ncbi:FMN-binding protein [Streptomyces sp. TM32]|uniref:FMN-binding protein n=1 Tax=Streptomyces sp. TM32 TaxID=1652669 RepID=UPI001011D832|nr:FMN-binding protein [Streptomyces sp. TM32]RXS83379.1 FMN-binding protein [Streptomyces sp. TM32]
MRRAVLTTASTSALVVLLLTLKPHHSAGPAGGSPQTGVAAAPAPTGSTHRGSTSAPVPTRSTHRGATSAPPPTGSTHRGAGHGNGTHTGAPVSTKYGTVQVAISVKAGQLSAVKVLQAPSEDAHSREIAAYALPRLTQEALNVHSARIDAVSGASYTSAGYIRSLQSALDEAGV